MFVTNWFQLHNNCFTPLVELQITQKLSHLRTIQRWQQRGTIGQYYSKNPAGKKSKMQEKSSTLANFGNGEISSEDLSPQEKFGNHKKSHAEKSPVNVLLLQDNSVKQKDGFVVKSPEK